MLFLFLFLYQSYQSVTVPDAARGHLVLNTKWDAEPTELSRTSHCISGDFENKNLSMDFFWRGYICCYYNSLLYWKRADWLKQTGNRWLLITNWAEESDLLLTEVEDVSVPLLSGSSCGNYIRTDTHIVRQFRIPFHIFLVFPYNGIIWERITSK